MRGAPPPRRVRRRLVSRSSQWRARCRRSATSCRLRGPNRTIRRQRRRGCAPRDRAARRSRSQLSLPTSHVPSGSLLCRLAAPVNATAPLRRQKLVECDRLLSDERFRERSPREQLEQRDDAGCRRKLDRRKVAALDRAAAYLPHEAALDELAAARADGAHVEHDDVVLRQRHFLIEDLPEQLLLAGQVQILQKKLHQVAMAGIADRLVVELAYTALERLAHGRHAAGGVERLVLDAVDREPLDTVERQRGNPLAPVQRLAELAVLVDQAGGAPAQVVLHLVARGERQRADAHLDRAHRVERRRERATHDVDGTRRETALRYERHALCTISE